MLGTSNPRRAAVTSSQKKHRGVCSCFLSEPVRAARSSIRTKNGYGHSKRWRKRGSSWRHQHADRETAISALAITVVTHDGRQDHRCRDGHFVCFGGCCWSILTTLQRLDGTVLRGQQFRRRGPCGNKLRAGPFLPLRQSTNAGNRNGANIARQHEFC